MACRSPVVRLLAIEPFWHSLGCGTKELSIEAFFCGSCRALSHDSGCRITCSRFRLFDFEDVTLSNRRCYREVFPSPEPWADENVLALGE